MWVDWIRIAGGLLLLTLGGEALVRGASGLALLARITPAVVGLTVVAAGTSMPEFVVSIQAAMIDSPGLAIGNVVGSNIFNIGAILGLTAVVKPLLIRGETVRLEWPVMVLACFQLMLLARDGEVDRLEGGFLLLALVAFVAYAVQVARRQIDQEEATELGDVATVAPRAGTRRAWWWNGAAVAAGGGLLAGGAATMVAGATAIATDYGVSDTVIGLTVVAAGTSAPELVTSLVAAWRGRNDIAVGNIIGSNIFNALGIVGGTALVHPLPVPDEVIDRDAWWMLGAAALLFPLMRSGMTVTRFEGAALLALFLTYMYLLIGTAGG